MFSGIVEEMATVVAVRKWQGNMDFTLRCSFVDELKIDQSVAHNGVCLTVVAIADGTYTVTAMKETLDRTNLSLLRAGDKVNVERSMVMNGRLDGHIVQGHVDETATCVAMDDADGSTYFTFRYAADRSGILHGRQGLCDCQRRIAHGDQPHRRHLPCGHHTLHPRAYQLQRHTCRYGGQYRV